jgi:hypothetical protein
LNFDSLQGKHGEGQHQVEDEKRARLKGDIAHLALPVLVERLGGVVTISAAEYEALWTRYGGRDRVAVRATYQGTELTLTLVSTQPSQRVS